MNLPIFRTLLSPAGQTALADAESLQPHEKDFLLHFQALRKRYAPALARAALETAILRREAAGKFPDAAHMYFTREALEQATSFEVSAYRAGRFREFEHIADLGCSIGGDSLPLAHAGHPVTGLDLDPLRLRLAQANARALGFSEQIAFIQANLTQSLPLSLASSLPPLLALFFDPARRTGYRRAFSVHDYTPPLNIIRTWLPRFPALGVKISPGVNLDELTGYDCEIEFISLNGELKEACLWFGPLKTTERSAVILPGPFILTGDRRQQTEAPLSSVSGPPSSISHPQSYLYEPDPSILRAGLVTTLAAQLNAAQLDPTIAYLTADERIQTPFARTWAIEDWMPFNLKKLRAYLRERNIGRVTVKKRGAPLEPESLIRDLKLKGDEARVLAVTRLNGEPVVLVCLPLEGIE